MKQPDTMCSLTDLAFCALCVVLLAQLPLSGIVFLLLAMHVFYRKIAS
jgi:hypothetical protein